LKLIAEGRLDPLPFATHRFPLAEVMAAYDTFAAAAETDALKVVLEAEPASPDTPTRKHLAGVAG
jgi:alcohol dehydrogenase